MRAITEPFAMGGTDRQLGRRGNEVCGRVKFGRRRKTEKPQRKSWLGILGTTFLRNVYKMDRIIQTVQIVQID